MRERQVQGPASADGEAQVVTVAVRRYRCRRCGGVTTVLPSGLCARRHYSASAIGLALCLFGLMGHSIGETRQRVCAWQSGFDQNRWSTLRQWVAAIGAGRLLPRILAWRQWPEGMSLRAGAERAAACLCSLVPGPVPLAERAFVGAALAA